MECSCRSDFVLNQSRYIGDHAFTFSVAVDSAQDRHLTVEVCQRLRFCIVFPQSLLQHANVIVTPALETPFTVRTNWPIRELCAGHARCEAARSALQPFGNTRANCLFR